MSKVISPVDLLLSPKKMLTASFATLLEALTETGVDKVHTVFSDEQDEPVAMVFITNSKAFTRKLLDLLAEHEDPTPVEQEDGHAGN